MKEEYYVYLVMDKETLEVMYIGKGKGNRYYHILSGVSNNYEANKAHHLGLTSNCVTLKLLNNVNNDFACEVEKSLIYTLQPAWNSDHKNIQPDVHWDLLLEGWRVKALLDETLRLDIIKNKLDFFWERFDYMWSSKDVFIKLLDENKLNEKTKEYLIITRHLLDEMVQKFLEEDEDWDYVDFGILGKKDEALP